MNQNSSPSARCLFARSADVKLVICVMVGGLVASEMVGSESSQALIQRKHAPSASIALITKTSFGEVKEERLKRTRPPMSA